MGFPPPRYGVEAAMAWGKAVGIELTQAERHELERRSRRRKIGRADAIRAAIVLSAAEGLSNVAIAERIGVTRLTVALWRRRFAEARLEGLSDEPRSGGAAPDRRRPDHAGRDHHVGESATGRHALEHALNGAGLRCVGRHRAPDLARLLPAAPPDRDVQALDRPALRREGARHRRALP